MTVKSAKLPGTEKAVRYPKKTGINLCMKENAGSARVFIAGIAVILALMALVAKFGVHDQFARRDAAEQRYSEVHAAYLAAQETVAGFDEVQREYRTYSRDWMQRGTDGLVTVDRLLVLDLIEEELMSRGTVETVQVSGDTVSVAMSGMDLEQISRMFDAVGAQPIVAGVTLNLAETGDGAQTQGVSDAKLQFSMTIILQAAEEDENES